MFKTFNALIGTTKTKVVDAEDSCDRTVRLWGETTGNYHMAIVAAGSGTPAGADFYRQEPELIEDFTLPEDYELWVFDPSGDHYVFGIVTR